MSIHYDITEYNVTNHKTLKEKYKSKSFQYYKKGIGYNYRYLKLGNCDTYRWGHLLKNWLGCIIAYINQKLIKKWSILEELKYKENWDLKWLNLIVWNRVNKLFFYWESSFCNIVSYILSINCNDKEVWWAQCHWQCHAIEKPLKM